MAMALTAAKAPRSETVAQRVPGAAVPITDIGHHYAADIGICESTPGIQIAAVHCQCHHGARHADAAPTGSVPSGETSHGHAADVVEGSGDVKGVADKGDVINRRGTTLKRRHPRPLQAVPEFQRSVGHAAHRDIAAGVNASIVNGDAKNSVRRTRQVKLRIPMFIARNSTRRERCNEQKCQKTRPTE